MVLLTTTPAILSAISLLPANSPLHHHHSCESEAPLPSSLQSPISHQTLIQLSRALRSLPNSKPPSPNPPQTSYTLNTLLHNTRPYHPPPPPPTPHPPSAEYLALKSRLLAAQEEREYTALLSNHHHHHHQHNTQNAKTSLLSLINPSPSFSSSFSSSELESDDPLTPTLILNILLSILLCAFSVFYATNRVFSDGVRVLLSLGGGVVVGVAESVVYAAYLRKVEDSRRREGRRREVKRVVVEDLGGSQGEGERMLVGGMDRQGEKEEIWGRGVNGGVRRRLRERWGKGGAEDGRGGE